ncbi:hypothetical protein WHK35_14325, partial [Staphylococcus aureus]|uniref:hypothetical protein n=1 Tax=Staphylococcus aureus TaxID=1280 RepID=UPI0039BE6024
MGLRDWLRNVGQKNQTNTQTAQSSIVVEPAPVQQIAAERYYKAQEQHELKNELTIPEQRIAEYNRFQEQEKAGQILAINKEKELIKEAKRIQ